MTTRERLIAALAKPVPSNEYEVGVEGFFDPWDDVIDGISGSYAEECDSLMIAALEAVRDRETFEYIEQKGFAGELMLYVLSGHGLTEYGTSPRGGWPDYEVADLWGALIEKWRAYAEFAWRDPVEQIAT